MAAPVFSAAGTASTGSTSPRTPAYPSSVAAGQIALCVAASDDNTAIGFPADWTVLGQQVNSSTGFTAALAWKRLAGSEANATINVTGGNVAAGARIYTFSGALDVGAPFESFGSQAANSATLTSGPTALAYIDRLAIRIYCQAANAALTTPAGWTNIGLLGGTGVRCTAHSKTETTAGSEPATSPTSASSAPWVAFDVAMLPTNEATAGGAEQDGVGSVGAAPATANGSGRDVDTASTSATTPRTASASSPDLDTSASQGMAPVQGSAVAVEGDGARAATTVPARAAAVSADGQDVSTASGLVPIIASAIVRISNDPVYSRMFHPGAYVPPNVIGSLKSSSMNLGVFWRLGTTPALHLWMGIGDVPIGVPSLDPAGTVYIGAGRLLQIPELDLLINGLADRIEFSLSGVDADFQAQLSASAPRVTGAKCTVGIAPLDERFQPMSQIVGVWSGTADFWSMEQKPAKPGQRAMRTVSVSVGSGDTSRSRPRLTGFTDPQQQIISPGDTFFDRVPRYTQDHMVPWPRFN